ncbi:MAG: hypothetical protein ACJ760_13255 [Thermoleophilaceae bacterium]
MNPPVRRSILLAIPDVLALVALVFLGRTMLDPLLNRRGAPA